MDTKNVVVIINPVSGQSDPEQRKQDISQALEEHGCLCRFIETSEQCNIKELCDNAINEGADLLAVSGGDGTVMQVLSALAGTRVAVAILPAGTGNLLSQNLGIPLNLCDAVDVALSGNVYDLDLARSGDGRHFVIMGGMGLDGQIIHDADRTVKNRWGVFAYFWAAAKNMTRRLEPVTISIDGRPPIRRRAKSVVAVNMGKMTAGLNAFPTASPCDGLLEIGILKMETFPQGLRMLYNMLLGRPQLTSELETIQATRVQIHSIFPQPLQFDGEYVGQFRDLSAEILPKSVCILVPEDLPDTASVSETLPDVSIERSYRLNFPVLLGVVALAASVSTYYCIKSLRK